jgi:hypothetical protein
VWGAVERIYKRALAIREKALGPDHPDVGTNLDNLAGSFFVQKNWQQAAELLAAQQEPSKASLRCPATG